MRTTSVNFRNANVLAGGELEATLASLRGEGLSFAGISSRLYAEHGIEVSATTVGAWLRVCGIDVEAKAS